MSDEQNAINFLTHANYGNPAEAARAIDLFTKMTKVVFDSLKLKPEPNTPIINKVILLDVLIHFQCDLQRLPDPNEYKVGGYLCFWIKKLKPFRFQKRLNHYTNELMALSLGHTIVLSNNKRKAKSLPVKVFNNILYDLRYRPVSPSVIANQFHMLYLE